MPVEKRFPLIRYIINLVAKMIREMLASDALSVLAIYEMGIKTQNATFETRVPLWGEWDHKHHSHSRDVLESVDRWALRCGWSKRSR